MAATRRGYIFGAFVSSVLSIVLIIVAISSDNWVQSKIQFNDQQSSEVHYGLFGGDFALYILVTPSFHKLYMTCIADLNACAVSCKTEVEARRIEVRALAQGYRPSIGCVAVTTVDETNPLQEPPVISYVVYIFTLAVIFMYLLIAVITAILAILNALTNPTEPVFGLLGCLLANVMASMLGLALMLLFGIYWATSGLKEHLAFSNVALSDYDSASSLGYSYWLLIISLACAITNVGLIELRRYLLERDPPPPTIKVENHSDGTIFLY